MHISTLFVVFILKILLRTYCFSQCTIIIFNDGEEVERYQADLSFKLAATREEVQDYIDELSKDKKVSDRELMVEINRCSNLLLRKKIDPT